LIKWGGGQFPYKWRKRGKPCGLREGKGARSNPGKKKSVPAVERTGKEKIIVPALAPMAKKKLAWRDAKKKTTLMRTREKRGCGLGKGKTRGRRGWENEKTGRIKDMGSLLGKLGKGQGI